MCNRAAGAPETWQQLLLAVALTAGAAACASFRAAAALFELPDFAADVFEITLFGTRPAEIDGVIVHESAVVGPAHVTSRSGIPVT